jgi:hypothetical protein
LSALIGHAAGHLAGDPAAEGMAQQVDRAAQALTVAGLQEGGSRRFDGGERRFVAVQAAGLQAVDRDLRAQGLGQGHEAGDAGTGTGDAQPRRDAGAAGLDDHPR